MILGDTHWCGHHMMASLCPICNPSTAPRAFPRPTTYTSAAIYLPHPNRIYIPIRKNAHTAIHEAIIVSRNPWWSAPPDILDWAIRNGAQVATLWRDPFERIESAYRFFSTHRYASDEIPDVRQSFADWVLAVCEIPDAKRDLHLRSQCRTCLDSMGFGVLEDVRIIPWDLPALAAELMLPPIPHLNATESFTCHWTDRAKYAFITAYATDIEIWLRSRAK